MTMKHAANQPRSHNEYFDITYEAKIARDNFISRKPTPSSNYDFERSQVTATASIKVTDCIFNLFMQILEVYKENMEY